MATKDDVPILIESYADMSLRERFVDRLDPKAHKLKAILGKYDLPHRIECALPDRTPHNEGCLVVTEDGTEAAIGHCCVAREFPDQYVALRKAFNIRRAHATHLDVIRDYQDKAASYASEIDSIWYEERGGWWSDQCRRQYQSMCPSSIRNRLADIARSASWTLTVRVKVDRDNALGLGFRRDQQEEDRTVGYLRGMNKNRKRSG